MGDDYFAGSRVGGFPLDAKLIDEHHISIKTKNVAAFTLSSPWPQPPPDETIQVVIDGNAIDAPTSSFKEGEIDFN